MKTVKTVVFVSNFFNHHQKPFSDAMFGRIGRNYTFIETGTMTQERKALGAVLNESMNSGCACESDATGYLLYR